MDDGSGGQSQGLLHLHPQKYTWAESGVASPKAFTLFRIEGLFMRRLTFGPLMFH